MLEESKSGTNLNSVFSVTNLNTVAHRHLSHFPGTLKYLEQLQYGHSLTIVVGPGFMVLDLHLIPGISTRCMQKSGLNQ